MKIMLVNDDGFRARGIQTLGRVLIEAGHEVIICAPDGERSGASHSFSFGRQVTAEPFAENGISCYAISGSPADCAALGLFLLKNDVDMVISCIIMLFPKIIFRIINVIQISIMSYKN